MKKLSLIILLFSAVSLFGQVSVIANKSVSDASLSASKVGSIFTLETTKWSNGSKIIVFDNSSDVNASFYQGIGKSTMAVKKEWLKKQLTGEAVAPENLGGDAEVIRKVSSTQGAIGFVSSSSVNGSVKVLCQIK
ncbi:MAG: hypothetical protein ACM3Q2_08265 [Syntrophothermus sp.]